MEAVPDPTNFPLEKEQFVKMVTPVQLSQQSNTSLLVQKSFFAALNSLLELH